MTQKATFAVFLAGALAFSAARPALADPPSPLPGSEPLAPGKPAGARAAQFERNDVLIITGAIVIIGVGLYLASGTYSGPAQPPGGNGSGAPTGSQ